MQGYSIATFTGGWKYTLSQNVNSNSCRCKRRACCCCGSPIVHLPETQQKTGALHFNGCNRPQSPRPFHVTNIKEVFVGVLISYDADRILNTESRVEFSSLTD